MRNSAPASNEAFSSTQPRILLTDTNRWPLGPRLAMGLSGFGCHVAIVCKFPGHPAEKTAAVRQTFRYDSGRPLESLRNAIDSVDPDIIIPLCDRSVQHLHKLHALALRKEGDQSKIVRLVEYSLGSPESFPIVSSRYKLLQVARSEGIQVPDMIAVDSEAELSLWCSEFAAPWVVKAEGTWGGRGVRIARSFDEAQACWSEFNGRPSLVELAKRLSLNRDRGWILSEWKQPTANVVVQSYINGRPANCTVACWRGELLAGIAVEVIQAQGPTEPAIVVQVVDGKQMLQAAKILANRLNLSGFFGLDFMIEERTELAHLIEMNPRCTPPCPMPLGNGRDLVAALCSRLTGLPLRERNAVTDKKRITYFPRNWGASGDREDAVPLDSTYYDTPEGEPELAAELLRPWSSRSSLGWLLDSLRKMVTPEKAPASCVFETAITPVDADSESVLRS